jgi:hypothetical protein
VYAVAALLGVACAVGTTGAAAAAQPEAHQQTTQEAKPDARGERAGRSAERQADRQAEKQPPDRPAGRRGFLTAPLTPERLRDQINNRLRMAAEFQRRLEEARQKLDDGADPAEVQRGLEQLSNRFVGGAGAAGGGGGTAGGGAGGNRNDARPALDGLDGLGFDAPPRGGGANLTAEELDQARGTLRALRPNLLARMEETSKNDGTVLHRALNMAAPRVRALLDARRGDDKDMAELRADDLESAIDLLRAARAYGEAARAGDREKLGAAETELRSVLSRQFDVRARIQARQIEQLSRRLENARAELNKSRERRDQIVEEKARGILRGARGEGARGEGAKGGGKGAEGK